MDALVFGQNHQRLHFAFAAARLGQPAKPRDIAVHTVGAASFQASNGLAM